MKVRPVSPLARLVREAFYYDERFKTCCDNLVRRDLKPTGRWGLVVSKFEGANRKLHTVTQLDLNDSGVEVKFGTSKEHLTEYNTDDEFSHHECPGRPDRAFDWSPITQITNKTGTIVIVNAYIVGEDSFFFKPRGTEYFKGYYTESFTEYPPNFYRRVPIHYIPAEWCATCSTPIKVRGKDVEPNDGSNCSNCVGIVEPPKCDWCGKTFTDRCEPCYRADRISNLRYEMLQDSSSCWHCGEIIEFFVGYRRIVVRKSAKYRECFKCAHMYQIKSLQWSEASGWSKWCIRCGEAFVLNNIKLRPSRRVSGGSVVCAKCPDVFEYEERD